jgi:hypothetical protein
MPTYFFLKKQFLIGYISFKFKLFKFDFYIYLFKKKYWQKIIAIP